MKEIKKKRKKLDIIYEDKELIVIHKPSNLLTIGTEKNREQNLYYEVSSYVKKQHPKNKIFIVHRLDKDTSGVVIFAKNESLKKKLQDNWEKLAIVREYKAVVMGDVKEDKATIKNYLKENKAFHVYATNDSEEGQLAITNYEVIKRSKAYTYLNILIETGRKNQIRVHLSDLGHPIVGDKKYGAEMNLKNPMGRLGLHANKVILIHPLTKKEMIFEAKLPKDFEIMINNIK